MRRGSLVSMGLGGVAAVALALAAAGVASADQPEPTFEGTLTIPLWLAALDAQVTAGDVTTDSQSSFRDILSELNWAIEGVTELRYQRAILLLDVLGNQTAVNVDTGTRTVPYQAFAFGPGGSLTVGPVDVHARTTMWTGDLKLGWRALSAPVSRMFGTEQPDDKRHFDVDLFAGVRYWNVNVDLDVDVAPASLVIGNRQVPLGTANPPRTRLGKVRVPGDLLRGGSRSVERRTDWWDPLVGIRFRSDVTESLALFAFGDLGGFGIGEASDLTWQGQLGLDWRFSQPVSLVVAYRALGLDRSPDSSVTSWIQHGPLLGLSVHF